MTFIEKYKYEHPGKTLTGCPADYGYETCWHCPEGDVSCQQCWNREIPEETVNKFNAVGNPYPVPYDDIRKVVGEKGDANLCPGPEEKSNHDDITKRHEIVGEALPSSSKILDSGNRREFESGAVRDIQEGKGRCDLMPLDVVAEYMQNAVIGHIASFQQDGDIDELYEALCSFVANYKTRWGDCDMLLEVSEHFEEGAKKYGENNWQKGIPVHCYINSAVRHYLKCMRGDKDEPHDRAFAWNLMCAVWTCKHKPELNEYARVPDPEADVPKRPYDLVAEAYKILVSARDGKANYDLDELIGYLGEALDE